MRNKKRNHPSIFFIGHFAIDNIIRFQKKHKPTLGGSVSFGSLSLSSYTNDVRINIISNLGSLNFDKSLLDIVKNKDIDLTGLKWSEVNNTNFISLPSVSLIFCIFIDFGSTNTECSSYEKTK